MQVAADMASLATQVTHKVSTALTARHSAGMSDAHNTVQHASVHS